MSAGGMVGMFVNFLVFSALSSAIGYCVDKLVPLINTYPGISMDAINTISNLHLIYVAGPFLFVMALGYNYIVTSNSESQGET